MFFLDFKEKYMEAEFELLDGNLQAIVILYAIYMWVNYGIRTTVTSVFRDGSGVHGVYRGCDLRTRGILESQAISGTSYINSHTVYDPQRPDMEVAVYKLEGEAADKFGAHEDHVHMQSHPKTIVMLA